MLNFSKLSSYFTPGKLVGYMSALVLFIALFWCLLRFAGLEVSPSGFYIDESGSAANAICLWQNGETFIHEPLPLYPTGPGGGKNSPTFSYFSAAWSALWGSSITVFRTIPALFTVFSIIGLFLIARRLADTRLAMFVALIAAVSPWSFHFSRLAWGAPMMVGFLIWGCYFLIRSQRYWDTCVAAIFFSLAMYSYQVAMASVPLIVLLLFFSGLIIPRITPKRLALFILTGAVACVPLIYSTFFGDAGHRFGYVSILTKAYLVTAADNNIWLVVLHFLKNFAKHFTPEFLIFTGDLNLRHSPLGVGQLGYLEIVALALLPIMLLWTLAVKTRRDRKVDDPGNTAGSPSGSGQVSEQSRKILILALAGIAIGVIPSALTWESIPHALRSIAAWPFYALLCGWIYWRLCHISRSLIVVPVMVSIIYTVTFIPLYFVDYPKETAVRWFDAYYKDTLPKDNSQRAWYDYLARNNTYDDRGLAYYLMHYRKLSCTEAQQFMSEVRKDYPSEFQYSF